jgi:hypothetical protein
MGTAGDPNNETQYFSQRDRLFQEALDAEWKADESRRRWRIWILSATICLIAGSVLGMMVFLHA